MEARSKMDTALNRYHGRKVHMLNQTKTIALNFWEKKLDDILQDAKQKDPRFNFRRHYRGSFYENVKVKRPNEFDILLEFMELDDLPYDENETSGPDPPSGFTTVLIDQGEESQWQRDNCANAQGLLNGVKLYEKLTSLLQRAINAHGYNSLVILSKSGPCVTLNFCETPGGPVKYSVDLTLAIKEKYWPEGHGDGNEWKTRSRRGWPSADLVQMIVEGGCFLINKRPRDSANQFLWKYSFSLCETKLMNNADTGNANCCRKKVLQILKALCEDYQLMQKPFGSYHLKTALLWESEEVPQMNHWRESNLSDRVLAVLSRVMKMIDARKCPNYFLREEDLFEKFNSGDFTRVKGQLNSLIKDIQQGNI